MFNIEFRTMIVNLYHQLKLNNINGYKRINIIMNITNFKFHINSLYNWIKNIQIKKRSFHNFKITNDIENFIIDKLTHNQFITTKQIKFLIKQKFNVILSKTSIYSIYKKNKFSFKKCKIISNPYSDDIQNKQILDVKNKLNSFNINNIISIDEMSITLNNKPYYGWSKCNERCVYFNKNRIVDNKRYSLLVASSNHKIINYSIVKGSFNTIKFTNFIKKIHNKNFIYFMDNAIIHKSKLFNQYVNQNNLNIIYNAPYHSEFNPIEYIFSLLRNKILSNDNNSFDNIIKIINNFKLNISSDIIKNMFNHSFKLLNMYK